jgi:hypothetical protein
MRLLRSLALALLALVALLSLAVLLSLPSSVPALVGGEPLPDAARRAVGVLHVHSSYSDGAGTVSEIVHAAAQAGLDFVVLTDHGDPEALSKEGEGYSEGVLLLVGSELSTESGHLLALEIPDPVFRFGTDTAEALRDVDEMGGFSIAAHPTALRPNFAWDGWELPGLSGIELFNFFTGWRRQSVPSLGQALVTYPFSATRGLAVALEWDPLLIEKWNEMLSDRDLAAWVGLDAHGQLSLSDSVQIPWPGYREVFAMARNHLVLDEPLTGDAELDREAIYRALERGQGYVSFDGIADGGGFRFFAEGASGEWPMGSHISANLVEELRLVASVQAPDGSRLSVLRDGILLTETTEGALSLEIHEPGIYRAEVRLDTGFVPGGRDQPWIVSNPIFVLPPEEIERRATRRESFPPAPSANGMACQPMGEEAWPVAFHAEHDPASHMDETAAESTRGSFRIDFQLSEPSDDRPYVWCAVADRTSRDLTGLEAVRFETRGDRVYRIDFQMRDAYPESLEEQTEWWATSFKTSPEWQEVVIPFARLRSISKSSDGRLDVDQTRGMFFVLDAGNTRPGVSGSIEVRDLELCAVTSSP